MNSVFKDGEFLFHDYMNYRRLNVNKLNGDEYANVVEEYTIDKQDLKYSMYTRNQTIRIYVKKNIPQKMLSFYRYLKRIYFSSKASYIFFANKNKYKYSTIYIAAGNRCAGTWLSEILAMTLNGYSRYHPTENYRCKNEGYFDINLNIANNIKNKLYVVCTHTPPKSSNTNILNEYLTKYIATIRDPRDIVVSLYYHMKKYPCGPTSLWDYGDNKNLPWETLPREVISYNKKEFIDVIIEHLFPGVLSLMEGWVDYSLLNKNVLIVKYEDLKSNTINVVQNIFSFYKIKIDDYKIIETIDALNPKNNDTIHINYSTGRVPINDNNYLRPHNDWDKHLTIDQKEIIETTSMSFFKKAGYV